MAENLFEGLETLISIDEYENQVKAETEGVQAAATTIAPEGDKPITTKPVVNQDDLIDPSEFLNAQTKDADPVTPEVTTEPKGDKPPVQEDPNTLFKAFAETLAEEGVLPELKLEEFDGTAEGLITAVQNEIKSGVEDYKAGLPAVVKHLLDNWEEGVPLDKLIDIKSNQIKYSSITEEKLKEDPSVAKQVVKELYKRTTKFSDAKIEKEISRLEDADELISEGKEALTEIKKLDEEAEKQVIELTKKQQAEQKIKNEETLKRIETTVTSIKEVIPGIKVTEKEAANILKNMTTPVAIDGEGRPISKISMARDEDPIGFDAKLNYLFEVTKGFTDFTKITNKAQTKAVKDLEKRVQETYVKGGKDNIKTTGTSSLFDALKANYNNR